MTEQLPTRNSWNGRRMIKKLFEKKSFTNPARGATTICRRSVYFVPMALALQLQKSGQYLAALDWIETVYADHLAVNERKIYRGLVLEETIPTQYPAQSGQLAAGWPESARDRHGAGQRIHALHAHGLGALLPGLRRCRVHAR